ncbi:MAG: Rap1a/Tai family immunity protein [Nitrososphaerales archaeon]
MKTWLVAVALTGPLLGGMAAAETLDGNGFLKACRLTVKFIDDEPITEDRGLEVGYCLGLIEGVRNSMILLNPHLPKDYKVCFPSSLITNRQAARIVVKYLDNHPAILDKDKTLLTMYAFADAYPCK